MATFLKHYGILRRSGRYPWGSGKDPYQRRGDFLSLVADMRKEGFTDAEIAKGFDMTTKQFRERHSIEKNRQRAADAAFAMRLKEKGWSDTAIGERMGKNESSVRSLLDPHLLEKTLVIENTANVLRDAVETQGPIDIGKGVETHLGITRTKMDTSVRVLMDQGYKVYYLQELQPGTGKYTSIKVLAPPGMEYADVYRNRADIGVPWKHYSEDGGHTYTSVVFPMSVDGKRIMIRYGDEGGSAKDGVIELREGVADISLGDNRYAQVRIGVNDTHYMKGMAVYGKDMPPGVDIIYNTKKASGTDPFDVYKPMKIDKRTGEIDQENPFTSAIRQTYYVDANGKKHLSAINMVGVKEGAGEEGSWGEWSRNLSSQVLSKQTPALAKKQLGLAYKIKEEEFDEIMKLTNPSVRKVLLQSFADDADAAAVHLKAAALPRQNNKVLLPLTSIKENEVYAPGYNNGEELVLIRHPHGGTFEIPVVKVNNRVREGVRVIGNQAQDAIGIHPNVAKRLSGADFDGDTVLAIPTKNQRLKISGPLKGVADFDPITSYPKFPGMKVMKNKDQKMGDISNLITDMTIKGASHDEIARAVRHSMVVIDAEKHELNYLQSYKDNGISSLKEKYQGGPRGGASTIISRAKSPVRVDHRVEGAYVKDPKTGKTRKLYIDPDTGAKLYTKTGETYINKAGKLVKRMTKSTRIAEEADAFALSSGTVMEGIYAKHANSLKGLANRARKTMIETKAIPWSSSARRTYAKEVESLANKVRAVYRNKPLERKAILLANKLVAQRKKARPDMDADELRTVKFRSLEEARARVGAKRVQVEITDREWHAIQAGAISPTALEKILLNTDTTALKQRAMPRTQRLMSSPKIVRAQTMLRTGYTRKEVADALGVSLSTLDLALKE